MLIKDFNTLPLNDKVFLVNSSGSKLIESHPRVGKYKTHLYEIGGLKVNVLVNSDNNCILLAHALEDSKLESLTDSIYLN